MGPAHVQHGGLVVFRVHREQLTFPEHLGCRQGVPLGAQASFQPLSVVICKVGRIRDPPHQVLFWSHGGPGRQGCPHFRERY
jgi:hypothetical protein